MTRFGNASVVNPTVRRLGLPVLILIGLAVASASPAVQQPGAGNGLIHRFEKVADGVYAAFPTVRGVINSNSVVIVGDRDVLVFDAHSTPAFARALIQDIKTITDKPIRYVVNSHYHFDHTDGNQAFPPEIPIIGHEATRAALLTNVLDGYTFKANTAGVPGRIESLSKQVAEATDPAKKAQLEADLAIQRDYSASLREIRPTPPSITLATRMTLFVGQHEVQLQYLGRGHTAGDLVLYLPKERVLCTADLVTTLPNLADAYVDEYVTTLEAVKQIDFDAAIPGHGTVFKGKEKMTQLQSYFSDLWKQATALRQQGLPAVEAAKRVDMTSHKTDFPQINGPGVEERTVVRIYEVLDERRASGQK